MKLEVGSQKSEANERSAVPKVGMGSYYWQLAVFFLLLTFAACTVEKEKLDTPDNYAYFPLEVGKYWVYEVDSIVFQNQTRRDSSKTWVKEQIIDYFIDNAGDTIYRVDQYERKSTTQPWEIKRVVSLSRNENRAIRTENNLPLIKMIFPLMNNSRWENTLLIDQNINISVAGNDVKMFQFWAAQVETLDTPYSIEMLTFPETTTILQAESVGATFYQIVREIYAKDIGLIERDWKIMETQCTTCTTPIWEDKAERGFTIRQQLIEHN